MGEFWLGPSPKGEIRKSGSWYPACQSKCKPLLWWMLQGLEVEDHPLLGKMKEAATRMQVIYEDEWLIAVNKPEGMLSVPGNVEAPSVASKIAEMYPDLPATYMVHRLDMDTSGILLVARSPEVHKALQEQFFRREVKKRYIALVKGSSRGVEGEFKGSRVQGGQMVQGGKGTISLPLSREPHHKHRQMVDHEHGKEAITEYEVLSATPYREGWDEVTKLALYPITGRTHQLRIHMASTEGMDAPIVGDRLYGTAADRLYLQAQAIEFTHPVTGQKIHIEVDEEF